MLPQRVVPLLCCLATLIGVTPAAPTKPAASVQNTTEPVAAKNFNVTLFKGRWYQMYASPSLLSTGAAGRNAKCVSVDYEKIPKTNGTRFSVRNYLQDPATNKGRDVNGTATIVAPGKFSVEFGNTTSLNQSRPSNKSSSVSTSGAGRGSNTSNFWVVAVGPVVFDEYEWVFVSNRNKTTLSILARSDADFNKKYKKEALAQAKKLGFDTAANKPVAVVHDDSCKYPDIYVNGVLLSDYVALALAGFPPSPITDDD